MTLIAYVSFLLRLRFWYVYNLSGHKYYEKAFLQFSPKHIKWSQFGHSSKRIFPRKLSASGGLRPPDPPPGALPPGPPLGAPPPDPLYRLALPRSPWEPEPPFHKSCLHPCQIVHKCFLQYTNNKNELFGIKYTWQNKDYHISVFKIQMEPILVGFTSSTLTRARIQFRKLPNLQNHWLLTTQVK